jgi:predicted nucleic acid-binding protein
MAFVLDASVTMSWYLTDETNPAGELAFERLGVSSAAVPILWWFEVRNALVSNERRGRLDAAATVGILAHLDSLPIRLDFGQDGEALLALARGHGLTVYDATLDRQLAAAARAAAVSLLGDEP